MNDAAYKRHSVSGSVKNSRERHFVLAGIAVYERQAYHLISRADSFVSSLNLGEVHDIELHGSTMANGKKAPWKGMSRLERLDIIERGLGLLPDAHWSVKAFAVAVDKHETAARPVPHLHRAAAPAVSLASAAANVKTHRTIRPDRYMTGPETCPVARSAVW